MMIDRFKSSYLIVSWLPLAVYFMASLYAASIGGLDGSVASIVVLPSILFSAAFFVAGLWIISESIRVGTAYIQIVIATLLSGSIFLWFLFLSLMRNL